MAGTPTDIANRSLDQIGSEDVLGDIEDGTRAAQLCLRQYNTCRHQLLRSANWNFARKSAPMVMLGARDGAQLPVGGNPVSNLVIYPWLYEYAYPIDCLRARCVPMNNRYDVGPPSGNIVASPPGTPFPGIGAAAPLWGYGQIVPAKWMEAFDPNYPSQPGQMFWETRGSSPNGSTVILTDVMAAHLIYTADIIYPNMWDPLFEEALVALIASWIVLPLNKDKKLGMAIQRNQIQIAREKVSVARAADGNEGISTSDISVDWMRTRRVRGTSGRNFGGDARFADSGMGSWSGWAGLALADGTLF